MGEIFVRIYNDQPLFPLEVRIVIVLSSAHARLGLGTVLTIANKASQALLSKRVSRALQTYCDWFTGFYDKASRFVRSEYIWIWEKGVVQPPCNVTWVWSPEAATYIGYVLEFLVGSFQELFFGCSGFPYSLKTIIPNFYQGARTHKNKFLRTEGSFLGIQITFKAPIETLRSLKVKHYIVSTEIFSKRICLFKLQVMNVWTGKICK